MAALSSARTWPSRGNSSSLAFTVKSGASILGGALVGIEAASGHAKPWTDESGLRFAGIALESITGDGTRTVRVEIGAVIERVSTPEVSADDTLVLVYCPTDNPGDVQIDPTSNTAPIALVELSRAGELCDLRLLTPAEYQLGILALGI